LPLLAPLAQSSQGRQMLPRPLSFQSAQLLHRSLAAQGPRSLPKPLVFHSLQTHQTPLRPQADPVPPFRRPARFHQLHPEHRDFPEVPWIQLNPSIQLLQQDQRVLQPLSVLKPQGIRLVRLPREPQHFRLDPTILLLR
jgi:hypothetical protein